MHSKEIAMTIVEQLGGNHAMMMIGAKKPLIALDRNEERIGGVSIGFKAHAMKQIKSVRIELMPSDTYRVRFYGPAPSYACKAEFNDMYCDQLQDLFEETTGLSTNLFGRKVQFG